LASDRLKESYSRLQKRIPERSIFGNVLDETLEIKEKHSLKSQSKPNYSGFANMLNWKQEKNKGYGRKAKELLQEYRGISWEQPERLNMEIDLSNIKGKANSIYKKIKRRVKRKVDKDKGWWFVYASCESSHFLFQFPVFFCL